MDRVVTLLAVCCLAAMVAACNFDSDSSESLGRDSSSSEPPSDSPTEEPPGDEEEPEPPEDDDPTDAPGFRPPANGDETDSDGEPDPDTRTVALEWNRPREREDGSTLRASDVDRYELHYGQASGHYTHMEQTTSTSIELSDLDGGSTYYFAVRVYDTNGLASEFSGEVSESVE